MNLRGALYNKDKKKTKLTPPTVNEIRSQYNCKIIDPESIRVGDARQGGYGQDIRVIDIDAGPMTNSPSNLSRFRYEQDMTRLREHQRGDNIPMMMSGVVDSAEYQQARRDMQRMMLEQRQSGGGEEILIRGGDRQRTRRGFDMAAPSRTMRPPRFASPPPPPRAGERTDDYMRRLHRSRDEDFAGSHPSEVIAACEYFGESLTAVYRRNNGYREIVGRYRDALRTQEERIQRSAHAVASVPQAPPIIEDDHYSDWHTNIKMPEWPKGKLDFSLRDVKWIKKVKNVCVKTFQILLCEKKDEHTEDANRPRTSEEEGSGREKSS